MISAYNVLATSTFFMMGIANYALNRSIYVKNAIVLMSAHNVRMILYTSQIICVIYALQRWITAPNVIVIVSAQDARTPFTLPQINAFYAQQRWMGA